MTEKQRWFIACLFLLALSGPCFYDYFSSGMNDGPALVFGSLTAIIAITIGIVLYRNR